MPKRGHLLAISVIVTINQPADYMGFMILKRGVDVTQAIGRVALKVEPFMGPELGTKLARLSMQPFQWPK